jgi:uncharacterized ferritin-like protein (DUF455 family)
VSAAAEARALALQALRCADPHDKCRQALAIQAGLLDGTLSVDTRRVFEAAAAPLPGRPALPRLLAPAQMPRRKTGSSEGRAAMLHAIAHIEFNAINLGLDIAWRFPGMPEAFYRDWLRVAAEEAEHFALVRDHLESLGRAYGDFPAHDGLWDMAQKTATDLLARLAVVPRTMEARGLDVNPGIRARLAAAGDSAGAVILDRILADEIGHVRLGIDWFLWLCGRDGLDPATTAAVLAVTHGAPRPKPPYNIEARLQAGFSAAEIEQLERAA